MARIKTVVVKLNGFNGLKILFSKESGTPMNLFSLLRRFNDRHGLNLIEIAIVMAVVGLVVGGIYVAAATVYKNVRESTTEDDILQIVQSMRNAYASQGSAGTADLDINSLVNSGILPSDMVTGSGSSVAAVNAFGGTVTVKGVASAAGGLNGFEIELTNIPQSVCIDILVQNTAGGPTGAAQTGLWNVGVGGKYDQNTVFPLTIGGTDDPGTLCKDSTNTVDLSFGVRG